MYCSATFSLKPYCAMTRFVNDITGQGGVDISFTVALLCSVVQRYWQCCFWRGSLVRDPEIYIVYRAVGSPSAPRLVWSFGEHWCGNSEREGHAERPPAEARPGGCRGRPKGLSLRAYPSLVREDVPYQEWFERVSLGSLMSLHEVEGGRVMGGVAMDSHLIRSSGQIERLESEILRLQLELSVSVDRHTADMDRVQGEMASMQTEAIQREGEMVQMRRDLASRDAEVARLAAAVRRLEEQLQGMGITPVARADPSGLGQPSSSPPRDPVTRDWFFDDPPSL
uniref:Uncharacterized protein n=1 Tax=Fagus sylvatica TaxID=28930 RepID=A0A2N9F061_FAGSY